ncbi:MAG: helix-hairpin-helix domain-containing protein [Pseudomonadota bacterium]
MTPGKFDYAKLWPAPTETPFEYWLSLSPAAPFFGVPWRFADMAAEALEAPSKPVRRERAAAKPAEAATPVAQTVAKKVAPVAKKVAPVAKKAAPASAKTETPASKAAPVAKAEVAAALKAPAVEKAPAKSKPAPAEAVAKAEAPAAAPKAAAKTPAKAAVAKPAPKAPAKPDDLTVIKGIGPKMAEALNAEGVMNYADIAKWSVQDVARMDAKLGGLPGRITRDDWVGQAKALAG